MSAATACGEVAFRVASGALDRALSYLGAPGFAVLEGPLDRVECRSLASLYPRDELFRSRVGMARHGFTA